MWRGIYVPLARDAPKLGMQCYAVRIYNFRPYPFLVPYQPLFCLRRCDVEAP
jgi:hypothetical protein